MSAKYGRDNHGKTWKWGLVYLGSASPAWTSVNGQPWRVVAWFKTRKACEEHAKRGGLMTYAICRIERIDGVIVA